MSMSDLCNLCNESYLRIIKNPSSSNGNDTATKVVSLLSTWGYNFGYATITPGFGCCSVSRKAIPLTGHVS